MNLVVSPDGRRFVGPRDVARILQLDEQTVRRRIKAGKIKATRTASNRLLIDLDELIRLVEEMTRGADRGALEASFSEFSQILAGMGL